MGLTNEQGKRFNRIWKHFDEVLNEINDQQKSLGEDASEELHAMYIAVLDHRDKLSDISRRLHRGKKREPGIGY